MSQTSLNKGKNFARKDAEKTISYMSERSRLRKVASMSFESESGCPSQHFLLLRNHKHCTETKKTHPRDFCNIYFKNFP